MTNKKWMPIAAVLVLCLSLLSPQWRDVHAETVSVETAYFYDVPEQQGQYFNAEPLDGEEFKDQLIAAFAPAEIPAEIQAYLNTTYAGLLADLNARYAEVNTLFNNQQMTASVYSTYFTAVARFRFDAYNSFVPLYNQYLSGRAGISVNSIISSLLSTRILYNPYHYLGYTKIDDLYNDEHTINDVYTRVYNGLSSLSADPAVLQAKTLEILTEAVSDWIKRLDLDYLQAYQDQVNQYITSLNEIGYKVNIDGTPTLDGSGTQPVDASNVANMGSLSLNSYFHTMNLDSTLSQFMTPEEVYQSAGFQSLVIAAMDPLTQLTSTSQADVVNALRDVIINQYQALSMPGASAQPITMSLSNLLSEYAYNAYDNGLELLPLTSWIDPSTQETPYDTGRSLNYQIVPSVDLTETLNTEVSRTIHYQFDNGVLAAADVVQTAHFTGHRNLLTDETTWDNPQIELPGLTNPTLTYPDPNYQVTVPDLSPASLIVTPDNANGKFTLEPQQVIYRYQKDDAPVQTGQVHVLYQDENGTALTAEILLSGKIGDAYTTAALQIGGYTLIEIPQNATGTYTIAPTTVIYRYSKDTSPAESGQVSVLYLDINGKALAPAITLSGPIGEAYQTQSIAIAGYQLLETPSNAQGTYQETVQTVTYQYQPIIPPTDPTEPTDPSQPTIPDTGVSSWLWLNLVAMGLLIELYVIAVRRKPADH